MVKMVPGTKLTILHCKCSLRSLLVILFFFVILLFSLACITPSLVSESLFVILFFFSVFARRSRGNPAFVFAFVFHCAKCVVTKQMYHSGLDPESHLLYYYEVATAAKTAASRRQREGHCVLFLGMHYDKYRFLPWQSQC